MAFPQPEELYPAKWQHCPNKAGFTTDYLQNLGVKNYCIQSRANLWDQLVLDFCARATNTAILADLRLMLVEELDTISQQCGTKLVTSIRRRCQVVVVV